MKDYQEDDERIKKLRDKINEIKYLMLYKGVLFSRGNNNKAWKVGVPEKIQKKLI